MKLDAIIGSVVGVGEVRYRSKRSFDELERMAAFGPKLPFASSLKQQGSFPKADIDHDSAGPADELATTFC